MPSDGDAGIDWTSPASGAAHQRLTGPAANGGIGAKAPGLPPPLVGYPVVVRLGRDVLLVARSMFDLHECS
jgi:hypothetical protein